MTPTLRFVDLADAAPDEAVVVVDVLRAFTVVPWLFHRGAARVLAVDTAERAEALRDGPVTGALLAGESGGVPIEGFDLGNSPVEVAALPDDRLAGRTVVHRTSAGTQGLVRTAGSGASFAASFVTARATATALLALAPTRVTFVITGASLGRDGDEDLAAAELIGAHLLGHDPDPDPFLARVPRSDAGRCFASDGPDWAHPDDLVAACEVDRFDVALHVSVAHDLSANGATPVLAVGPA
ncbi:2-phosphosulfolactate phosphatase [Nitriliruptor alkaliphilus]|uniref:2-phosphosulfolactate phosphatase n=1 Tax=Nitriliruptor alkaliphilus TaxID=427918 RepID=UPI000695D1BA|nr:2-phosphosulfolactate phosphatase [Nitriliruptor alkaliphilus]